MISAVVLEGVAVSQSIGVERDRPSDILPPLPDLEESPEDLEFTLPAIPELPDDGPLSAGPRFLLEGLVFEGNTVVSDEALLAASAD